VWRESKMMNADFNELFESTRKVNEQNWKDLLMDLEEAAIEYQGSYSLEDIIRAHESVLQKLRSGELTQEE